MNKFLFFILLLSALPLFSKAQSGYGQLQQVKLANIDSSFASYTQVLANPRLSTGTVNCEVTEFTITFTVKDGPSYGPYPTKGFMLTDEERIMIKNLRNDLVKVQVSNISMRCDGQLVQAQSFSLYMGY